ncbi:hypothetical protein [Erythrobacter aureus]|uniref:Uncharacterized protein n=1 Tax=Erythrobacter aureus TaxID=2182384 RepID=A0A345YJB1_9SPHN|nr:hypothetical protein [Erythrobacter aureus]AXK44013.1 hypothetical protein DVR09_16295 [Erythrobacter aureus]
MAIPPVQEPLETEMPTIAVIEDDHNYSMIDDDEAEDEEGYPLRINQTRFYRGDNVLVSLSRLDEPNTWDDEHFDALCDHLLSSWNAAAAGTEDRGALAAKLKELVDNARAIEAEDDGNLPYFAWQKVRVFCYEHIDTILATLEQANRPPKPITKDDVEQAAKAGHEAHWGEGTWDEAGPNERDRDRTFAEGVLTHISKGSIQDVDYKAEWEAAALARDEAGCPFMTPAEAIKHLADEVAELRKSQAA